MTSPTCFHLLTFCIIVQEAERLASEERQRQQQEEIERVRAKQREKEEEEQKKKDQSLASKFMKLGEKATGWTMVSTPVFCRHVMYVYSFNQYYCYVVHESLGLLMI